MTFRRNFISKSEIRNLKEQVSIISVARSLGIEIHKNRANCFIHKENDPSLSFNPRKGVWHCHGCGEGGDVISLVEKAKGVSFKEAIKYLLQNHNVFKKDCEIRYQTSSRTIHIEEESFDTSFPSESEKEVNKRLYKWIFDNLDLSEKGVDYLKKRGLSDQTIEKFQLKDILYPDQFFQTLKTHWGPDRLKKAGLMSEKGKFIWWDHRIVIPFFENGSPSYFQGRSINAKSTLIKKYVNLVGIRKPIFNQDILLKMKKGDSLFIFEGVFDTMAAVQDKKNAIGLLGANHKPISIIDKLRPLQVFILFDNDSGGQKGARNLKNFFIAHGIIPQTISLPKGINDFSDYVQKTKK